MRATWASTKVPARPQIKRAFSPGGELSYIEIQPTHLRLAWHRGIAEAGTQRAYLISPEVLPLRGLHLRHSCIRLAVVVIGVPEEESDSALVLSRQDLDFDVFRRVGLGAPGEGLEPWTDHDAAAGDYLLESLHRLPDEVLGGIPRFRVA